jgi:hypothetical protein
MGCHASAPSSGVSPLFPPEAEHKLQALAQQAIQKKHITARAISADKCLHWARGPLWHKKDRQRKQIPEKLRGVDRESQWGFSPYHKWVQGYGQCAIVNATPGEARFPRACTAGTANVAENPVLVQQIPQLPKTARKVLLDGTYDDDQVFQACQQHRIIPIANMEGPVPSSSEARKWAWRHRRKKINRRLYARRRTTIEPNFGNSKRAFENQYVWFYGLGKNQTHLVMTNFVRAIAMFINFETGYKPENVQVLLDSWQ